MSNRINQTSSQRVHEIGQDGLDRRGLLKCMAWAGAGVLWMVSDGVPRSLGIGDAYGAMEGLTFVQISDTHIGFNKGANPHPKTPMADAVARVRGLQTTPSLLIHTGDIVTLSLNSQRIQWQW